MIPNVVIHLANEQPLLADLFELPETNDAGMLCTNLRGLDGKRPVFIDHTDGTFYFPFRVIRFLEIPPESLAGHRPGGSGRSRGRRHEAADDVDRGPIELPEPKALNEGPIADDDADLELDEEFLQRIRDI